MGKRIWRKRGKTWFYGEIHKISAFGWKKIIGMVWYDRSMGSWAWQDNSTGKVCYVTTKEEAQKNVESLEP